LIVAPSGLGLGDLGCAIGNISLGKLLGGFILKADGDGFTTFFFGIAEERREERFSSSSKPSRTKLSKTDRVSNSVAGHFVSV
jgi:hypothetical protein